MIVDPRCRLVFGGIDLTDDDGPFHALGSDSSFGNPAPVTVSMQRMLQDGELVSTVRHGNREMYFVVEVDGADAVELAAAEAELMQVVGRRTTLEWSPPDGFGPTTVFDVQTSSLQFLWNDDDELTLSRFYGLTITALPFGRSVDPVVDDALTGTGVPAAQVDACDSLTGWTAKDYTLRNDKTADLSLSTATKKQGTASIKGVPDYFYSAGAQTNEAEINFYRTFAAPVDFSSTPYLSVQVWAKGTNNGVTVTAYADGVKLARLTSVPDSDGWVRHWFICTDSSVSELRFRCSATLDWWPSFDGFYLDDVQRQGDPPTTGSGKQSMRSIDVSGSVRTPGSLEIVGTGALSDVLVWTGEDDGRAFRPDLRVFRDPATGNTPQTDANAITGTSLSLSTSTQFNLPAGAYRPGAYALIARAYSSNQAGNTITATAWTMVNGATIGAFQAVTSGTQWKSTNYQVGHVGVLHLPPTTVPGGSSGTIRITMSQGSGAQVYLDELWLFPLDGALTMLRGVLGSRVWIDSPSADQPLGGLWVGTAEGRADAYHAGHLAGSLGSHEFQPPRTKVFVVTSGSGGVNPAVRLEHHPRWHTNAAR